MGKGSADLQFMLARQEVPAAIQGQFYHSGITTIGKFATIVDSVGDLKVLLRDEFGVDETASLAVRVIVSAIVVAFKLAQSRLSEEAKVEGEMTTKQLQKLLPPSEWASMRKLWEAKWWCLEDSTTPGRSYLEKRADEIENGDMRAEPLTSVLSRDEDQVDGFTSFWDSTGTLQLRKGGTTVPEPTNPEQLRRRIKLMGVGLMMLGMRHSNRPGLQGISPQDMEDFLSYLLGEFVWQLTGKASDGSTVMTPAWSQLLIYEFSIRKRAYHIMQTEGKRWKDALVESWKDPTTKERFFTTPVAMSATLKRPLSFTDGDGGQGRWKQKGSKGNQGKGGGKGSKGGGKISEGKYGSGKGGKGGKGSGKGKDRPDYCFAYNNSWERCNRKNCNFKHICLRCGGKHPVYQCTNSEHPASETQGGGSPVQ